MRGIGKARYGEFGGAIGVAFEADGKILPLPVISDARPDAAVSDARNQRRESVARPNMTRCITEHTIAARTI